MELEIRSATSGDAPLLADLAERTWSDAVRGVISHDDMVAHLAKVRSKTDVGTAVDNQTILVAEAHCSILGWVEFGDVVIPEVDVRPGDQEIRRVYVQTSLQGRGIGRQLMTAALAHPRFAAAKRIFLQVWKQNERAIRLYESLGFRTVGATTFAVSTTVLDELVLLLESTDLRRTP